MKLGKAMKKAKKQGANYIAVDEDKEIYMYSHMPMFQHLCKFWFPKPRTFYKSIGKYTGNIDSKNTLRVIE